MKLNYKNLSLNQFILFISANLLLVSCGTYQNVANEDGIYNDEPVIKEQKQVIVVNEKEYKKYDKNYFTKKLETLKSIDENEIFTDVNSYNSDYTAPENETLNYDNNQPWGYEGNDVVVHINLIQNPYWYDYSGWDFYYGNNWNYYGNGYNYWPYRSRYYNSWGYNHYGYPYYGDIAWNLGFYNPYNYNRTWIDNTYNRNYSYGRRAATNSLSRRNSNANSRYTRASNTRRTSPSANTRATMSVSRRGNTSTASRRSSTISRNTSSTSRGITPARRSSSSVGNSTSSRRSASPTTSRRSNYPSSNNSNSSSRRSSSSSSSRNSSSSSSRSSSSRSSGSSSRSTTSRSGN